VQLVDQYRVARFREAIGESWNLEPADSTINKRKKEDGRWAYDSWKEATSSKTSGRMKLRRDQSSAKLFYEVMRLAHMR
jgi:hypothetical protein